MDKRIHWRFPGRGRRSERPTQPQERASGEEAVRTREEQDAEATPSDMTRLKTSRL